MDDDDDIPQLSSHTLAALQEFYLEQQQREGMKTSQGFNQYSIGSIEEDWVRNYKFQWMKHREKSSSYRVSFVAG